MADTNKIMIFFTVSYEQYDGDSCIIITCLFSNCSNTFPLAELSKTYVDLMYIFFLIILSLLLSMASLGELL